MEENGTYGVSGVVWCGVVWLYIYIYIYIYNRSIINIEYSINTIFVR